MNLKELDSFKLSDAVTFHDHLNPALWVGHKLKPAIKEQLLIIAKDFLEELGIEDLDVVDVTVSGSNAAYSYTKHSDLDLHILVDMRNLNDDEVYKELFNAKKTLYNDSHHITINNIPVELYVQDASEPVVSLGEYSILHDDWLRLPTKRRANFDQTATKEKYAKLQKLIELALLSKDIHKVQAVLKTIKRYRQAGLDRGGEFGPENLAFKALRSQGYITKLYQLRDVLHSQALTFETMYQNPVKVKKKSLTDKLAQEFKQYQNTDEDYDPNGVPPGPEFKPTMPAGTVRVDVSDVYDWYKLGQNISDLNRADPNMFGKGPPSTIMAFGSEPEEHKYINNLKKLGLTTTDIDPVDPNQPKNMPRQKTDPTYNVDEARTNPEQNAKAESGMKELEAVAKTISDPENWAVSMTSEPKLGINPQVGISEDTPKGIYFYPLNYVLGKIHSRKPLPWGNDYPYIQLFQYDRSGEMTRETKVDPAKLKQALNQYCSDEVIQQAIDDPEYDGTPYWTIYDCLSRLGKGDETNVVRWNKVLRDLGFTSVFDPGHGWIAYNEPTQGVVLDPRIIKQHKTITNRKQASVVTPAKIEQAIFETMDMELASNRAWQAYDPDGVKLRAAAKEYAKDPKFKPYMGKPGTEEIYDKASGFGRWGARQLSDEAWAWYKAQQAQQPVNEAFDQPYKLKWEKSDYGDVDAIAQLSDGTPLSIMFNKQTNDEGDEAVQVEFYRNNSQEVTSEGDAMRIFATVLSAIQHYVKEYAPARLTFSASKDNWAKQQPNSESRAKLYDRLVQRYSKAWGYRAYRADSKDLVTYELARMRPLVAKEDTMQYASEKISATNPYGGQRDIQYRGSISEASGYIPSEKEKNDPRFKTALTVDVKPDTIKKNAKAFAWLTDRAGIPPTANPNGKF